MKKRIKLLSLIVSSVFVLAACGPAATTAAETKAANTSAGAQSETAVAASETEQVAASGKKDKYRIAFAIVSSTTSSAVLARNNVEEVAARMGNVEIINMDNAFDPNKAVENARNAIAMQVDCFIEYQMEYQVNETISQMMKDAGIPVLAVQMAVPDAPLYAMDNVKTGYLMGKALADYANANWKDEDVVVLYGNIPQSGQNFVDRQKGGEQAIEELFPGKEKFEFNTKADSEVTRAAVTDFLTAHPNQKVLMWMHIDEPAIAAEAAAANAGRSEDVIIASSAGTKAFFTAMQQPGSRLLGSLAMFAEKWGEDLVPMAIKLADGEEIPELSGPPLEMITNENLGEYYPEYVIK